MPDQKNRRLQFVCPNCGGVELEEIVTGGIGINKIEDLLQENHTELVFSQRKSSGGDVVRYNCAHCSFVLRDPKNIAITSLSNLVTWLRDRQMLK